MVEEFMYACEEETKPLFTSNLERPFTSKFRKSPLKEEGFIPR
jgi:hypothetical protein